MYGMITNMWLVKLKGCSCKLFYTRRISSLIFFIISKKYHQKQLITFRTRTALLFLFNHSMFTLNSSEKNTEIFKCQSIFLSTWNRCTNLSELIFKSRRMRKRLRIDDGCSCSMHEKAVSERKIGCCFVNIFQYDCEHRWSIKTRICKYDGTKILVSWKV